MNAGFEELEHTADVSIRVWGRDLGEFFAHAALALAHQLADLATVELTTEDEIDLTAGDVETLLVAWLGELLYLGERDGALEVVFVEFDIREVSPVRIQGLARGGPAGEYRRYIKAVTFSDLVVRHTAAGYETAIVFDV